MTVFSQIRLTDYQLHTIFGALRLYQREGYGDPTQRPDWLHDIVSPDTDDAALDDGEIDRLCDWLNRGRTTPQPDSSNTALCLWEASLELSRVTEKRDAAKVEAFDDWARPEGAYEARDRMIELAPIVDEIWERENADFALDGIAFDWEFCPLFLNILAKLGTKAGATAQDAPDDRLMVEKAFSTAATILQLDL